MELGAFSISLAVTDIEASRRFYEKFGFKVFCGEASQNWLILKNGDHVIGLFQGMFEKNILTFNARLKAPGLPSQQRADGSQTGQLHRRGPGWKPEPPGEAQTPTSGRRCRAPLYRTFWA